MEKMYEVIRIEQVKVETEREVCKIVSPEDAVDLARDLIGREDREVFLVMCLSTKNDVIAVHRAHVGALNSSIVHPREVFKAAILNNAASIIGTSAPGKLNPLRRTYRLRAGFRRLGG